MSGYCPTCGQAGCSSDHEVDWKLAFKLDRLSYLVNKTYWIDDNNQVHQALMDNLLADLARDILEDRE